MKFTIEKATHDDCTSMDEIQRSSVRELGKGYYSKETIEVWSYPRPIEWWHNHIRQRHVVVAKNQDKIVGFGAIDLNTGEIYQVYVRPDYTRQGVGRLILQNLLDNAVSSNLKEVSCDSSLNAESFYSRAGFKSGKIKKHTFPNGSEMESIPMSIQI